MLGLTRHANENVVLILPDARRIEINVEWVRGNKVRLGLDAPQDVAIWRGELLKSVEETGANE
jgi:carbon storage regulator CsrA